jgi:hypothetical protein
VYTGGVTGSFAGFSANAATGVLTGLAGSPFASGAANPVAYVTDSAGRIYSANFGAGQVRAFTTVSGVPAGVAGNPFTSGLGGAVHGVLAGLAFGMMPAE